MSHKTIGLVTEEPVVIVRLNRPERMNAVIAYPDSLAVGDARILLRETKPVTSATGTSKKARESGGR